MTTLPTSCKKCGKPLNLFDGAVCGECEKGEKKMICDDCGYCVRYVTEKGRNISCNILDKHQMEHNILNNHCVVWTPKKVKKRRKRYGRKH